MRGGVETDPRDRKQLDQPVPRGPTHVGGCEVGVSGCLADWLTTAVDGVVLRAELLADTVELVERELPGVPLDGLRAQLATGRRAARP